MASSAPNDDQRSGWERRRVNSEDIIAIANELDCGPTQSAVMFALMIAEHCAQLAEECTPGRSAQDAADAIRSAFRVATGGGH
jgi:hypothetical protein